MPNLLIVTFKNIVVYENSSYFLEFSVKNNGIWDAKGVKIIIQCQSEEIILFNNSNTPINVNVEQTINFKEECSLINETGEYTLEIIVDQLNDVNETYSNKDGSYNSICENDNYLQATLTIISENLPGTIIIENDSEDEDEDNKDSDIDEYLLIMTLFIVSAYSIVSTAGIVFLLRKIKSWEKFKKFSKKKSAEKSYK
jgi:hypothetical protein